MLSRSDLLRFGAWRGEEAEGHTGDVEGAHCPASSSRVSV